MSNQVVHVHKGKPLTRIEEGLVTGDVPAIAITMKCPEIQWNGSKIPVSLLRKTVAFSRYVTNKYGGECQWRLLYNSKTDEWGVGVAKQFISHSLASKEAGEDGDLDAILSSMDGDGWGFNGTGHTHCKSSAFMSGTDHKNELNQTGFHYTVGKVDTKHFDIHCRYSFRGIIYDNLDPSLFFDGCINFSTKKLPKFPRAWFDKLVEPPKVERPVGFSSYSGTNRTFTPHTVQRGSSYVSDYPRITSSEFATIKDNLLETFEGYSLGSILSELQYMSRLPVQWTSDETLALTSGYDQASNGCFYCGDKQCDDGSLCGSSFFNNGY